MAEIRDTIAEESGTLARTASSRGCAARSVIAVVLAVLQQVTGINTVIYYGSIIFKEQVGGQSESAAIGANVHRGRGELPDDDRGALDDRQGRPQAAADVSAAGMAVSQIGAGRSRSSCIRRPRR